MWAWPASAPCSACSTTSWRSTASTRLCRRSRPPRRKDRMEKGTGTGKRTSSAQKPSTRCMPRPPRTSSTSSTTCRPIASATIRRARGLTNRCANSSPSASSSRWAGREPQVKGHIAGNLLVGNDKQVQLDTVTQLLPYIGYPRTLNAIACLNEVVPEHK